MRLYDVYRNHGGTRKKIQCMKFTVRRLFAILYRMLRNLTSTVHYVIDEILIYPKTFAVLNPSPSLALRVYDERPPRSLVRDDPILDAK